MADRLSWQQPGTNHLRIAAGLLAGFLGVGTAALLIKHPGWFYVNPWLHAALEGYSDLIGLIITTVLCGRFYYEGRNRDLLIAAGFLATALTDIPHSLTYPGLLLTPAMRVDISAWLWLAGRLALAALLLAGALSRRRTTESRRPRLIWGSLLATVLYAGLVTVIAVQFSQQLPVLVRAPGWVPPGDHSVLAELFGARALTPLKMLLESAALLGFLASLLIYWRQYRRHADQLAGWLALALIPLVYSEVFFIAYPAVYGATWYVGHFLKVASYLVLGVWLSVESLALKQELLEERQELLETYREVGRVMTAKLERQELLRVILSAAVRMTDATSGIVQLADGTRVETPGCTGQCPGLCNVALQQALQADPTVALASGEDSPHATAAVPLAVDGEILGSICLGRDRAQPFTESQLQLLLPFAAQAAAGVKQTDLYQARLEEQERRERFLSVVAHELKTPLTSIKGYAQMLRRALVAAEEAERADLATSLDVIARQTDRMSHLIDDVLDLKRASTGALSLTKTRVRLDKWLPGVLDHLREAYPGHAIAYHPPGRPLAAVADAERLTQVVENIVSNAANYSPEGSTITVSLSADGASPARALITVQDEGRGIEEPEVERIFQPFYRSESSAGYHRQGIGLGLYISRAIIREHGGDIEVHSRPEQGSTFEVSLPLEPPAESE